MKFHFRLIYGVVALTLLLGGAAGASPILWTLNGVTLSDGGTASGTFTFNPDTGTPCGFVSPCGTYSNVHIVTTNGSSQTGATYSFVCGQNVVGCTGVRADSTEVLFLASNAANQSGNPAIAFFFTGISGLPPQGLTDAGGIIDVSSSGSVGTTVQEANCTDAACDSPSSPARFSTAGTVSAAPEPATWFLWTAGFGVIATLRRRWPRAANPVVRLIMAHARPRNCGCSENYSPFREPNSLNAKATIRCFLRYFTNSRPQ